MDLEAPHSSGTLRMIDEENGRGENTRQVDLHENSVSWRSVASSNEKTIRKDSSNQCTSSSVNRSNKIAPFLGGFVNPLANVTTPMRKANISPSNYHTGYESDSSSSGSTNSLHESLFPKTASWRMMSISGRRPSNVKILSMDHSGSWRVLSQKGSKKRQLPSFPMMVCTLLCHLVSCVNLSFSNSFSHPMSKSTRSSPHFTSPLSLHCLRVYFSFFSSTLSLVLSLTLAR